MDTLNNADVRAEDAPPAHPTLGCATRFWIKLGFISFGGPTGQIAIMHSELVERKRWISEPRFLHALNFCMLLPGPEAQQLATYIGWLLHGVRGGIIAGSLFVLPSAVLLWALSYIYVVHGQSKWVAGVFEGLKPVVLAIVISAVIRIGRRALKTPPMWAIALLAFLAMLVARVPFPLIIASAAVIGLVAGRYRVRWLPESTGHGPPASESTSSVSNLADPPHPTLARSLATIAICLALWWTPVAAAGHFFGASDTLVREGVFFSKTAMVTFGGAYAVLPYVAQQAVECYGWLTPPQMLDGLGLAETTPGPLIMVVQFVGFIGAWNNPGSMAPLAAATLGAALTTWVTFLPCFLWIFLGAPYIEKLRKIRVLSAALSVITAAVVGVVLNLAVWFGWHILVPASDGINLFGLVLCGAGLFVLVGRKWGIVPVVLAGGAAGLMLTVVRSLGQTR